jgi:hypothetical protein
MSLAHDMCRGIGDWISPPITKSSNRNPRSHSRPLLRTQTPLPHPPEHKKKKLKKHQFFRTKSKTGVNHKHILKRIGHHDLVFCFFLFSPLYQFPTKGFFSLNRGFWCCWGWGRRLFLLLGRLLVMYGFRSS